MNEDAVSTVNRDSMRDSMEVRKLKDSLGQEKSFLFHIIDSAEKWEEASQITCNYEMPILGSRQALRFSMHGMPLIAWEEIEAENPIPQWLQDDLKKDEAFLKERALAEDKKRVAVLEKAIGGSLPGTTTEEKIAFLNSRNPGELDALYIFIENEACNFSDGNLLALYNSLSSNQPIEYVDFKGFDEWKSATESRYYFRMHRPTQDYIVEIPLKSMSRERKKTLDEETRIPDPPQVPKVDQNTRRVIVGQMIPNTQDASWVKTVRAISQKRIVLYFSEILPFEIPGNTTMDKYGWLGKRCVGDVVRLRNFIDDELLGYKSRYDFFSRSYGLPGL